MVTIDVSTALEIILGFFRQWVESLLVFAKCFFCAKPALKDQVRNEVMQKNN